MSGPTRHVSGNREPRQRRSLVLPGLAVYRTPCPECYPSLAPDICEAEFQGDHHCCRNFEMRKERGKVEGTNSLSCPATCLCPHGYLQPKVWVLGESSVLKLHMGVATPQFKQTSQKVRGAEWEWREGSSATSERWKWQARAPSRWSEWKGVSQDNQHDTCNTLREDSGMMKDQLWTCLVSLSSEVCGRRRLDFSGSRLHVCVWVMQKQDFWQKMGHMMTSFFSVTRTDWLDAYSSTIQLLKIFSAFKHAESVPVLHSCCALSMSAGQITFLLLLSDNNSPSNIYVILWQRLYSIMICI